ncbi:NAD(P)H-dependent oxidoreductase [Novosphingobium sp. KACC 22771]|uniref:NAD(P)H-dependent oxidoreductase n=1 Tax=Novosphingobium sp. KACC 22771 TaxID=3025670 RepID=UPI0023660331|nr:NAD(P)H-dependent oxidoreductase [Novosphingobium sp. KACC 22771]WDF75029.1 NAD(P)H-dependent oxidoreductase [Novosphingobium sp. KACC 22771]
MSKKVVILAGGGGSSKTSLLVAWIASQMAGSDIEIENVRLADLDCRALGSFDLADPGVARMLALVNAAHGVIVATPIYKASFAGVVKLALDVLPQFGLAGKAVLPVATAGSLAHALALDYALRPVLQSMGARYIVQSTVASEADWVANEMGPSLLAHTQAMLSRAVEHFAFALDSRVEVLQLGSPRVLMEP